MDEGDEVEVEQAIPSDDFDIIGSEEANEARQEAVIMETVEDDQQEQMMEPEIEMREGDGELEEQDEEEEAPVLAS